MTEPKYTGRLAQKPEPPSETLLQDLRDGKYTSPEGDHPGLVEELLQHYRIDRSGGMPVALYNLVIAMAKAHGIPAFKDGKRTGRPDEKAKRYALVGMVTELIRDGTKKGVQPACEFIFNNKMIELTDRTTAESLRIDYYSIFREMKNTYEFLSGSTLERIGRTLDQIVKDEAVSYAQAYRKSRGKNADSER